MTNAQATDEQILERFGYRQELNRSLGFLSSFALSFSVISVTTGLFAIYDDGLRLAGPAFIWTWPIVGAGQFLVALVFARLARRIPVSGYAYQWGRELAGPRLAWWAGWMMIVQFITGLPGVCYALAHYLAPYLDLPPANRYIVALTVGILFVIAIINHFGITLASLVNNFSVFAEIFGTTVAGILLLVVALSRKTQPWGFLFSHPSDLTGLNFLGRFAFSSVMGAWTLTGFESAANLAEETRNPERLVPGAIIYSEVSSIVVGFLVLVGFTLAIPSLEAVSNHPAPLLFIMSSYFPPITTHVLMVFVFISIFACALANLTTLSRMVWAMARDRQLPVSAWLAQVSVHRVPAHAIWAVTILSILFVLWARFEIVITGTASLAGYVTYTLVVGAALAASRNALGATRSLPPGSPGQPAGEALAGTAAAPNLTCEGLSPGLPLATLVWLLVLLVMLSLPRSAWRNSLATLAFVGVGIVCYRFRRENPALGIRDNE